jgi:hypothetical protein
MTRLGGLAAIAALVALNGIAAWMGVRGYDAFASRHWTEVTGTVVASGVVPVAGTDTWLAHVEYDYPAPGGTRRGSVLTFDAPDGGLRYDSQVIAARVANTYPVGRSVKVYVDPASPQRAVLERTGAFRLVGLAAFFASVTVLTDVLAVAYVWHARRTARSTTR